MKLDALREVLRGTPIVATRSPTSKEETNYALYASEWEALTTDPWLNHFALGAVTPTFTVEWTKTRIVEVKVTAHLNPIISVTYPLGSNESERAFQQTIRSATHRDFPHGDVIRAVRNAIKRATEVVVRRDRLSRGELLPGAGVPGAPVVVYKTYDDSVLLDFDSSDPSSRLCFRVTSHGEETDPSWEKLIEWTP